MTYESTLKLPPRDLMMCAKNGSKEAYAALYEEFYTPIFRYVYQRTLNYETAEDITQTVFLKVFQSVEKFCDQGISPLAYFFTVARNTIIDLSKKQKRECKLEADDPVFERIEELHETPTQTMKTKEQKKAIVKAMQQLSPDQRDALNFRFVNGLGNPEIANIMKKSEVLVRQLQCRGIKQLKTLSHLKSYI